MEKEIREGDFIELEYTGKVKNGEIFDTNKEEDAKKLNLKIEGEELARVFCIGKGMLLSGLEKQLIGKEIPGEYEIELPAKEAFGLRNSALVKILPLNIFKEKNLQVQPGMVFALDNMLAKILSVSGGRVVVDFNNPLTGKDIVYKIKLIRKITELNEKISSLIIYFLKKKIDFEIKGNKIILKEKIPYIEIFSAKFKEILGMELGQEEKFEEKPKEIQKAEGNREN